MSIKTRVVVILIALSTHVSGSQYEYWEGRFQTMLSCNSKSGAAISEVKITRIQNTSDSGILKITGNYRQAIPLVASFGSLSTNNFAENTGTFQGFVNERDEIIIRAAYKISFFKGKIAQKCLKSNVDEFDF